MKLKGQCHVKNGRTLTFKEFEKQWAENGLTFFKTFIHLNSLKLWHFLPCWCNSCFWYTGNCGNQDAVLYFRYCLFWRHLSICLLEKFPCTVQCTLTAARKMYFLAPVVVFMLAICRPTTKVSTQRVSCLLHYFHIVAVSILQYVTSYLSWNYQFAHNVLREAFRIPASCGLPQTGYYNSVLTASARNSSFSETGFTSRGLKMLKS